MALVVPTGQVLVRAFSHRARRALYQLVGGKQHAPEYHSLDRDGTWYLIDRAKEDQALLIPGIRRGTKQTNDLHRTWESAIV